MAQEKDDLHERMIWGKIIAGVEGTLTGINARIEKRTAKSIQFVSSGCRFEVKIERLQRN